MLNKIKTNSLLLLLISSQLLLTGCNPATIKQSKMDTDNHEIEAILQIAGHKVTSAEDAFEKATKAMHDGDMDLAQLYFVKGYNLEPDNIKILTKLTELYINLKKYELAELGIKLLLEQNPSNAKTLEQYGLLLIQTGNYADAEENLNKAVSLDQSWSAYNGLGIIANLLGDPEKAENLFRKADSLSPNSPELLNNIGFSLYSAKKLDQAEAYYLQALAIDPNFKKAAYNYALLQARLKNYDKAYFSFSKQSTTAEAYNNTGYIAMINGDYKEAKNYFEEAIHATPFYYKKANDNLAELNRLDN